MKKTDLDIERLSKYHDIKTFHCREKDVTEFLIQDASYYQEAMLASVFLIIHEGIILNYFTLSCDRIRLNENEVFIVDLGFTKLREFPALKLGRLGTHVDHEGQGLARLAVEFSIGLICELNDHSSLSSIGCRFLVVDAIPTAIGFYEHLGFVPNQVYGKRRTTSMRFDIKPIK